MREQTYYYIQEKIEPIELERLVTTILFNVDRDQTISYKFPDIRKIGGTKDKGQDAISIFYQKNKYKKTIYAISKRKDFKKKIEEDLKKVYQSKNITKFVFISTKDVGNCKDPEYNKKLKEKYNIETEIFDINDLVNWLDNTPWERMLNRILELENYKTLKPYQLLEKIRLESNFYHLIK